MTSQALYIAESHNVPILDTNDPTIGALVTTMGTLPHDSIAEALFGKTRRRVLTLLYGRPDISFYLRQITRETETGIGSVQRELERLTGAGLITRAPLGNQVHFRANQDSPVFQELHGLINKTTGLADVVRSALTELAEKIHVAFVFGSVAKGSHTTYSDVDLLIVGDLGLRDVVPLLSPVQDQLGREVNPTVYRPEEFRSLSGNDNHFLGRVMREPRIFILGNEDELGRLVGKPLP
jgi:predicted nucleotidyltransferase